jgi:cytochrome c oxidase cbb3-type subunit 3
MIRVTYVRACTLLLGAMSSVAAVRSSAQDRNEASPAAAPVPTAATAQTYPVELIEAGRQRFAANCGFCHGRDATGGSGGSDLTRSELVAEDLRGDRIGTVVRGGRVDAGMPAFPTLTESDLEAIVAFIHDRNAEAASATGGRRSVEVADLATGNARTGARYFDDNCTGCHSASGDLAGIASRLEGLALLRRMLFPGSEGPAAQSLRPSVTVTTRAGQRISGSLAHRDEFTIALTDASGRYRSWPAPSVEIDVNDPLEGHVDLLGRYTDREMHDVLAFLQTLR